MEDSELVHPVGGTIKYSNVGYGFAGAAIAAARGRDFDRVIRARILEPLGMRSSFMNRTEVPDGRLAQAELRSLDGPRMKPPVFDFGMSPAGFLYTTVPDLGRFMEALLNWGSPIADSAGLAELWRPATDGYSESWDAPCDGTCRMGSMEVGLGADLFRSFEGYTRVRHGGGVYGFSTEFAMLPEAGVGVIVISTLDSSASVVRALADAALRGWLRTTAGEPVEPIPLSPDPLPDLAAEVSAIRAGVSADDELAGTRFGDPIVAIEVLASGADHLDLLIEGLESVRLLPDGEGRWVFPRFSSFDGEPLVIERDGSGVPVAVRIGTGPGTRYPLNPDAP